MSRLVQLKKLAKNPVKTTRSAIKVRRFRRLHPELSDVIERVRERRLSYLNSENLIDLSVAVLEAERLERPGVVLEAGTALGGSAAVLARSKAPTRPLWVFDAFGMIPPPTEKDGPDVHERFDVIASGQSRGIGGDLYYGYHADLLEEVIENLRDFEIAPEKDKIAFVKGYYEKTMPGSINFPVAIAHLDCDWYESLMICLREIEPHLTVGGRFVIDDYYDWSGCTRAVDEFFAGNKKYRWEHKSRLNLVKLSP